MRQLVNLPDLPIVQPGLKVIIRISELSLAKKSQEHKLLINFSDILRVDPIQEL